MPVTIEACVTMLLGEQAYAIVYIPIKNICHNAELLKL